MRCGVVQWAIEDVGREFHHVHGGRLPSSMTAFVLYSRLNGPVVRYVLRDNPPPWVVKMYVTRVQFPVEPSFFCSSILPHSDGNDIRTIITSIEDLAQ